MRAFLATIAILAQAWTTVPAQACVEPPPSERDLRLETSEQEMRSVAVRLAKADIIEIKVIKQDDWPDRDWFEWLIGLFSTDFQITGLVEVIGTSSAKYQVGERLYARSTGGGGSCFGHRLYNGNKGLVAIYKSFDKATVLPVDYLSRYEIYDLERFGLMPKLPRSY